MAMAAAEGAGESAKLLRASDATPDDLLEAGAYLFVFPENLAAISGEMKEMFDRCYYPVLGKIEGRAYATLIAAGSDGENAQRQVDRIATGWRLKRIADPVIFNFNAQTPEAILAAKKVSLDRIEVCEQMGTAMAEGLTLGIY